jgi:LysM repeat protein
VYFKQPDDTLWEIAKRYRVTTQEIMIQNNIGDKDPIPNYTPLIIIKEAGGMV